MTKPSIRLRPVTEADLPNFVRWFNDPEVTQWLNRDPGATMEEERAWFARFSASETRDINFIIEAAGEPIGTVGITPDEGRYAAKFGIVIGEKSHWGRGYGAAATREMLRIGFEDRSLQRIYLTCWRHNMRAVRCYERCGFRMEGLQRQARVKCGRLIDVVNMAILREEWEARQRGLAPEQLLVPPEEVAEWQHCMNALSPRSGEVIVDAGCGDGARTLLIASHVAPSGHVIGIEHRPEKVEQAVERIAAHRMQAVASARCGDIRSLPLADNSVDAWFCRETLEYLDDPSPALAEAVRVVRPGGRVVAMEADWDTLAYNATDKAAERRLVALHTDCGGGGSLDGRAGRKLLSVFRGAGLADVRLEVHASWSDRYSPDECYVCRPLGDGVVHRGCITREELDAWYADMSAQAQRGRYFHCVNYFVCVGSVRWNGLTMRITGVTDDQT